MKNLSIKEIFSVAWKDTKKNWLFFLGFLVVYVIIGIIDGIFGYRIDPVTNISYGSSILSILIQLIMVYISVGLILETLKIVDGKRPSVKNIFNWPKDWKHLLRYFGGYIVYSLIIILPIIILLITLFSKLNFTKVIPVMFIVGGIISIIISVYMGFAYYLMAENRNGIFSNILKSFKMVSDNLWKVVKWYISAILIFILPLITIGVISGGIISLTGGFGRYPSYSEIGVFLVGGLLILVLFIITIPWIIVSFGHLYRNIDSEVKRVDE